MTPRQIFEAAGQEYATVRITKAPSRCANWVGKVGPLRHKMTSEPMIAEGMLVFGAIPDPDGRGGGSFFSVAPDGSPDWDFELAE